MTLPKVYQCPACGTPWDSHAAARVCELEDWEADRDARRR